MSLVNEIRTKRTQALKERNGPVYSILTVLLGDIENKSTGGKVMSDVDVVAMIKKYITNNNDTIKHLSDVYATDDLNPVYKLNKENEILAQFLPQQLTPNQIAAIVLKLLASDSTVNIGNVMKYMKDNYAGQYDGQQVSQITKALMIE